MCLYPMHEDPTIGPHYLVDDNYALTPCSPKVGADWTLWDLAREPREPVGHMVFGADGAITQLLLCSSATPDRTHTLLAIACDYTALRHPSCEDMDLHEIHTLLLNATRGLSAYQQVGGARILSDLRHAGTRVMYTRFHTLAHMLDHVLHQLDLARSVNYDISYRRDADTDAPHYNVTFTSSDLPFVVWPGLNRGNNFVQFSELGSHPAHTSTEHEGLVIQGPDGALFSGGCVRTVHPPRQQDQTGYRHGYRGSKPWCHLENPFKVEGQVVTLQLSPTKALTGLGSSEVGVMLRTLMGANGTYAVAVGDAFRAPLEYYDFAEHLTHSHGFDLPGLPSEQAHLLWSFKLVSQGKAPFDSIKWPDLMWLGNWQHVLSHQFPNFM